MITIDKTKNMENKETLEDYVLNSDEHNNLKSDDGTYLNFHRQSELLLKGAKLGSEWQQEQDKNLYSEEDLLNFGAFVRIEDKKEKRLFLIQDYFITVRISCNKILFTIFN